MTTPPRSTTPRCRPSPGEPTSPGYGCIWPGSPNTDPPARRTTRSPARGPRTGRCGTTGTGCCATAPPNAASSMPTPRSPRSTTSYTRHGLGKVTIERDELPETAPRALDEQARIRWLRAVQAHLSPQDRTIALIPYYAGARISEIVP